VTWSTSVTGIAGEVGMARGIVRLVDASISPFGSRSGCVGDEMDGIGSVGDVEALVSSVGNRSTVKKRNGNLRG
jgi:hypothetical protein